MISAHRKAAITRGSSHLVAQATGVGLMVLTPAFAIKVLPFLWKTLGRMGALEVVFSLREYVLLAPLAMIPLWIGYWRSRRRLALVLGGLGVASLLFHQMPMWDGSYIGLSTSFTELTPSEITWAISGVVGTALLFTALAVNAFLLARWSLRGRREAKLPVVPHISG